LTTTATATTATATTATETLRATVPAIAKYFYLFQY